MVKCWKHAGKEHGVSEEVLPLLRVCFGYLSNEGIGLKIRIPEEGKR